MINECPNCKRRVDVYTVEGKFEPYSCNCGYLVVQGETEVRQPEPVVEEEPVKIKPKPIITTISEPLIEATPEIEEEPAPKKTTKKKAK